MTNRKDFENVALYVGPSVEFTAASGKKTLFVAKPTPTAVVEATAREHRVTHIYATAGHCLNNLEEIKGKMMVGTTPAKHWADQVEFLIQRGWLVTVEYPAHKHELALRLFSEEVWKSTLFIPVLNVVVPHITTSNKNLTIKFDDVGFDKTNPGVWTLAHHEITDSNRFTDWRDYLNDAIVEQTYEVEASEVTIREREGYTQQDLAHIYKKGKQ